MGVFQLFLNDVLGYKVVVHVHGYRSPSNLLGQITIHKAQGLTLDKVVIDIGKEFSVGLMLPVHVCVASQTMFNTPFAYQRVASLTKSMRLTT